MVKFAGCSGEDCPFHPSMTSVRLCCSNCYDSLRNRTPFFKRHPALNCPDFPLSLENEKQRPFGLWAGVLYHSSTRQF